MSLKASLIAIFIVCVVGAWICLTPRLTAAQPDNRDEVAAMKEQTVQLKRIADALEILAGKRNK